MDSSQGTQYIYQLPEESQVPESQSNGELYAAGEGEGSYEQEMIGEEGQAGLAVGSSADELERGGQAGEEALFTYAQGTGEMPISSSDITTSYAIAEEGGEGGMTQVYFLTEDGVLTTAMPDMGDGTLMLQPVEGGEGEGQLQVVYQQIDEGMAPESSTSPQYVTMPVEGINAGGEYMDMQIAEGAVGSTSMEQEAHAANVAVVHAGQGEAAVKRQPMAMKMVSQPQSRGGAHVTLVGVPSKKPATTIITVQKPQAATPGGIIRTPLTTPRTVTLATPGSIGTPSSALATPNGQQRCNVCRKVNCTTKHRVKFPGESKLNRGSQGTYIVQMGESSGLSASESPMPVRGAGPGRPRGGRGRGGRGSMTTAMGFAPLDTSSASDSESTPTRGAPRGRGGRGGVVGMHVAEGGVKSDSEGKQLPGLQGHWLKAMHGTSLMEVDESAGIAHDPDVEDVHRVKPLVEVKRMEAAKTVILEIKRPAGGEQAKATVLDITKGGQEEEGQEASTSSTGVKESAKSNRPVVVVTKLPADKEKLAATIATLVAEGKKGKRDTSPYEYGEEEDTDWVPSSSKKKTKSEDEDLEGLDEAGRKSHRERKLTSKFAEFVTQVAPGGKTVSTPRRDSGTSMQSVKDEIEELPPKSAPAPKPIKRKAPITVSPSQVVLSYGKMQAGGPRQLIVQPPVAKDIINKGVLCKPYYMTKATMCRPYMLNKEVQTEEGMFAKPVVIPVPVPICLPTPMAMYTTPTPYPLPLPIPVPVPCFIPLTKRTADIILKHIKELSETEPADPFEAELLHMAEMVAKAHEEAPPEEVDTKGALDVSAVAGQASGELAPEDVLQIALRMASEIPEETVVDFEEALDSLAAGAIDENAMQMPDAQSFLKYTFGVNAWKLWVLQKNIQIEQLAAKQPSRAAKQLFKTELLQCTPEELNYSLCLFVKEVRKPNGDEYAPDSIYYLCLGIQQYLYENGRLDNIFTDVYYEKFTDCLNEVLQRYEIRLNTQGMVVARIEEEHLWETRQLGAHSPFVLLNTLIYFNTKYFLLKSAEEHLSLAFTDIMKHWKKTNSLGGKAPGKMFFLRYFAPLPPDGSGRKRRDESVIFEQPENLDNPLRCPVKLYEFYLSKCPESVRNRNDLFYLVPEKSCVPDSPVWYSTQPLGIDMMVKMLSRLRIVRELQEIYLHQAYEVTIQI